MGTLLFLAQNVLGLHLLSLGDYGTHNLRGVHNKAHYKVHFTHDRLYHIKSGTNIKPPLRIPHIQVAK